jgi:hypothetical protein
LKYVEDSILRQEEEEGSASAELRQLRSDLREALSLFNTSNSNNSKNYSRQFLIYSIPLDQSIITIDESEPSPCVTLSSDSDSSDDEEEENSIIKEIVGLYILLFSSSINFYPI